jgi:DNA-binding response OmpR family regulator
MYGMGHILLVEDDDLIRALLTETLAEEGYAVRSVSNRVDMHKELAAQPPALLICDVDLDRGSDSALIDDMHAASSVPIPLLLMTTDDWTARSLARQGLIFCLLKPFNLDDLLASVAVYIRPASQGAAASLHECALGG